MNPTRFWGSCGSRRQAQIRKPSHMHAKLNSLTAIALLSPVPLGAQEFLEQFSYEGLGLSGIGFTVGRVASDRLTAEWSGGVLIDYGMIAPRVRVMLGANYFKGELAAEEIVEFETSLRNVVQDPTGDAVIDVGRISWANLEATLDLQYLLPAGDRLTTYLGFGFGIHVRDGSGAAIENTFVEDALDTVAAGANLSFGAEVILSDRIHFTTDVRGGWSSELLLSSARAGLLYRILPGGT